MTSEDLTKPLGLDRRPPQETERSLLPRLLAGGLALGLSGGLGWVMFRDVPFGGEPHAVARIERNIQTGSIVKSADPTPDITKRANSESTPDKTRESASELEDNSGVKVIRGKGASAPTSVVIRVPGNESQRALAGTDRRLLEQGRHGPIPVIARDGARPSDVYARPYEPGKLRGRPKVAIMLTGLGISTAGTSEAISRLPADVSLAFAPYGTDLERQVARAKEEGHEVLLQLPMEPMDYPDNDPGPQTLITGASESQNIDRMHWLMARFTGYVGVTNYLGAKFTGATGALRPVLGEAAKRGLLFVDDGSSGRSQISAMAAASGVSAKRGDVVLDTLTKPTDFAAALARAETLAKSQGSVLVVGPALPMTIENLQRWTKTLEQKGVTLVPVSALVKSQN